MQTLSLLFLECGLVILIWMQTSSFHTFQKCLGAHIQGLRKARHLSQEEVGHALGMDRVSIGYIEQGKRAPKLSTLYALADLFDVEVKEFFDFSYK